MSRRSGEMVRRAALGIGGARNGGDVAREMQTIRYSALDRNKLAAARQASRLVAKRKDKAHLMWALSHEISRLKGERQEIVDRLEKLGRVKVVEVTDHALVRFLERFMRIDIQAIRDQVARLVPPEILEADRVLYSRSGYQFLVKNGSLITVLDQHMDGVAEEPFLIDGKPLGGPDTKAAIPTDDRLKRAGRVLALQARANAKARQDAMTARLKAELGRAA